MPRWYATCPTTRRAGPAVYTALRGLCYAEISVRTLERDLHSGSYGGVAPNAHRDAGADSRQAQVRERRDPDSRPVRSGRAAQQERARYLEQLPFDREHFLREEVTGKALTGLRIGRVFERVWALPTFEIHGIKGGFIGEGAKTVIPAQATAKVSLRLVPGQRFEEVGRALERAVAAAGARLGRGEGDAPPRGRPGSGGRQPSRFRDAGRGVRGR